MKVVVITGSTKGIGFGLAQSFLASGCAVVVNGRTAQAVDLAVDQLAAGNDEQRLFGFACDVTVFEQVQALWNAARSRFGKVDVWINNAGTINAQTTFLNQRAKELEQVVCANLLGTMHGCRVALEGMLQQGSGQLYNMEGYGHDGSKRSGMTLYGTTKYAVRYFTESLAMEFKNAPVQIGTLGPGIVMTDLLIQAYREGLPENRKWAERIFSFMSDDMQPVCSWLVQRVLGNRRSNVRIAWLTLPRILHHVVLAPFRRQAFLRKYKI